MKNIILTMFIVYCSLFTVVAQAPNEFKYQTIVRDISGNLVKNTLVSFRVSILRTGLGGTLSFQQELSLTTNQFGLANLTIGSGINTIGRLDTVAWGSSLYFIEIEYKTGSNNYEVIGASQLLSVPYAMYSGKTAALSGSTGYVSKFKDNYTIGNSRIFDDGSHIGIGTTIPSLDLDVVNLTNDAFIGVTSNGNTGYAMTRGTTAKNALLSFQNSSNQNSWSIGNIGTEDFMFMNYRSGTGNFPLTITSSNNVGIGITSPSLLLDVNGRMQLRGDKSTSTAGLWLYHNKPVSGSNQRAFFGMANDTTIGFWGNLGANWSFAMNVKNGFTGIGTQSPVARLHVTDNIKLGNNGSPFDEIIELAGDNTPGNTEIILNYPSGYNNDNIRVLTFELRDSNSGNWLTQDQGYILYYILLYPTNMRIELKSTSSTFDKYRMIIMKMHQ